MSWYTSQFWAIVCIQVPTREVSWPKNQRRKLRWRSPRNVEATAPFPDGSTYSSGRRKSAPSGGSVRETEWGRPIHGTLSAAMEPPFPALLPP